MQLNVEFVELDEVPVAGKELAQLLVDSKLAESKTKARQYIKDGAVKINDRKVIDPFARLVSPEGRFFLMQKKK
mgnify:CR=1 FL=1